MRELKVPQSGAKKKLLDAAERLVTEKGFDLVSVRDITGAIKANVAAVNYHFGSREGLMDLVMMRTLEPICEHKAKALNDAVSKEGGSSAREIISAYVDSLVTAATDIDMTEKQFLRLAGRILVLPDVALAPSLAFTRREIREKYLEALARALPDSARNELCAAWDFFEAGVAQSLLSEKNHPKDWILIGIRCLAGGDASSAAPATTNAMPELAVEQIPENGNAGNAGEAAEEPETAEPTVSEPTKAAEKQTAEDSDKQVMLFDF